MCTSVEAGAEDSAAFHAFFERHYAELARLAHLLTGEQDAADDLAADALVAVWRHWERVRAADDPVAYTRGVVANLARSRIRSAVRERRRVALFFSQRAERVEAPDVPAVLDLREALQRLPFRKRACVVLRHAFDLSEKDTAAALGISVGTVKSQTSRGVAELERLLAPDAAARPAPPAGPARAPGRPGRAAGALTAAGAARPGRAAPSAAPGLRAVTGPGTGNRPEPAGAAGAGRRPGSAYAGAAGGPGTPAAGVPDPPAGSGTAPAADGPAAAPPSRYGPAPERPRTTAGPRPGPRSGSGSGRPATVSALPEGPAAKGQSTTVGAGPGARGAATTAPAAGPAAGAGRTHGTATTPSSLAGTAPRPGPACDTRPAPLPTANALVPAPPAGPDPLRPAAESRPRTTDETTDGSATAPAVAPATRVTARRAVPGAAEPFGGSGAVVGPALMQGTTGHVPPGVEEAPGARGTGLGSAPAPGAVAEPAERAGILGAGRPGARPRTQTGRGV